MRATRPSVSSLHLVILLHSSVMTLEAIRYRSGSLQILNQLLLPHQTVYDDIRSVRDGYEAIKSMKVTGVLAPLCTSSHSPSSGMSFYFFYLVILLSPLLCSGRRTRVFPRIHTVGLCSIMNAPGATSLPYDCPPPPRNKILYL